MQRWSSSIFLQGLEYTVCSGTYLLGGYGIIGQAGIPATDIYLQRTYTQLSSTHTMIYFSFTLWALDTWNGNSGDSFQLEFDLRIMTGWMFNPLNDKKFLNGGVLISFSFVFLIYSSFPEHPQLFFSFFLKNFLKRTFL